MSGGASVPVLKKTPNAAECLIILHNIILYSAVPLELQIYVCTYLSMNVHMDIHIYMDTTSCAYQVAFEHWPAR